MISLPCAADKMPARDQRGAMDSANPAAAAPAPDIEPAAPIDNPWSKIKEPLAGPAESIGGYSAGCIKGAQRLSSDYPYFQLMKPKRRRYFGHPDLIEFIRRLGRRAQDKHLATVLVGDMGQPRGEGWR